MATKSIRALGDVTPPVASSARLVVSDEVMAPISSVCTVRRSVHRRWLRAGAEPSRGGAGSQAGHGRAGFATVAAGKFESTDDGPASPGSTAVQGSATEARSLGLDPGRFGAVVAGRAVRMRQPTSAPHAAPHSSRQAVRRLEAV